MGTTIEETLNHLQSLARLLGRDNVRYVIVVLLLELGIPTNYDGFEYLKEAVMIYFEDPSVMFVKGLYPAIAETDSRPVDGPQVESAIRSAIKVAWKNREEDIWDRYFHGKKARPSNAEFISRIARMVELWEGCCKEEERGENKGEVLYVQK